MEKIHLEFPLRSNSRTMIWDMVGTRGGLEAWMADRIIEKDGVFTFCWGNNETRDAELLAQRVGIYIRMRWLDESPKNYFELRIQHNDLTNSFTLEVTELTDDEDVEGLTQLWEGYAEKLSRVTGV